MTNGGIPEIALPDDFKIEQEIFRGLLEVADEGFRAGKSVQEVFFALRDAQRGYRDQFGETCLNGAGGIACMSLAIFAARQSNDSTEGST
jgi:hypothetical protein